MIRIGTLRRNTTGDRTVGVTGPNIQPFTDYRFINDMDDSEDSLRGDEASRRDVCNGPWHPLYSTYVVVCLTIVHILHTCMCILPATCMYILACLIVYVADCKFNCHKKCASQVPKNCLGEMKWSTGKSSLSVKSSSVIR